MSYSVGIDLGGTNIKAVLLDASLVCVAEKSVPTRADEGIDAVLRRISNIVQDLAGECSGNVRAVGVTAPAVVRLPDGTVELMPNFPDSWSGYPLRQNLEKLLSIPVHVLNDARAATYAEKRFGAGRGFQNFIYLTLGTGVGGGVVVDNHLVLGSRGVAGEIGHTTVEENGAFCGCGSRGCLETVASAPAIVSAAVRVIRQGFPTIMREMCDNDLNRVTPELVAAAADSRDDEAGRIITDVSRQISRVLRNLICTLNPEVIIIGGGVGMSVRLVRQIEQSLRELPAVFPEDLGGVQILQAAGHAFSGALGAAAWASERHVAEKSA